MGRFYVWFNSCCYHFPGNPRDKVGSSGPGWRIFKRPCLGGVGGRTSRNTNSYKDLWGETMALRFDRCQTREICEKQEKYFKAKVVSLTVQSSTLHQYPVDLLNVFTGTLLKNF